ncbi:anti-sigma factor domain-containing protein [Polluticaenibacter yanchengensis]|uniref:anti-sigma factor domain-containing protein n=1 Tax=Polluticaenibacter yanchengensis TaxID=3014562 RepID=UPI00387B06D2
MHYKFAIDYWQFIRHQNTTKAVGTLMEQQNTTNTTTPEKAKTIPQVPTPKPVRWLQSAIAILTILLMGSILLNFHFYSKFISNKAGKNLLYQQQAPLHENMKIMADVLTDLKNSSVEEFALKGEGKYSGIQSYVFYDSLAKEVYLININLPAAPNDLQYQVWGADSTGAHISLAVLTKGAENLVHKYSAGKLDPKGFVISLEKKGGNHEITRRQVIAQTK